MAIPVYIYGKRLRSFWARHVYTSIPILILESIAEVAFEYLPTGSCG
jgi:hypothetical protein